MSLRSSGSIALGVVIQGSYAYWTPFGFLAAAAGSVGQCKERLMGWAEPGGDRLAWLYFEEGGQGWPQAPSGFTSARLGLSQSWAAGPVAWLRLSGEPGWQAFCLMLMKAVAGEEGEAPLLSCTCPCWGPQRETRDPPHTQVAVISLPSLTLMAPHALGVWTEFRGGKWEQVWSCAHPLLCFPGSILKNRLV